MDRSFPFSDLMFYPAVSLTRWTSHFLQQIIVSGVANTPDDVQTYASCTLLASSLKDNKRENEKEQDKVQTGPIEACIAWLLENEFIQVLERADDKKGNTAVLHSFSY